VEDVIIRALQKEDLDAIVEIDEKVLGESRKDYWERKIGGHGHEICPNFVRGRSSREGGRIRSRDISGWEFGVPDTIGWIDTIGVDPAYQKKGIATVLANELIRGLKGVGVKTIYTLVSWNDWTSSSSFMPWDLVGGI